MIIIVQSDNIIDLFKDFAALASISVLDDCGFLLAKLGFCGLILRENTDTVCALNCPNVEKRLWTRGSTFILLLALMCLGLGYLTQLQRSGYYLDDIVTVTFGDNENFFVQAYNGNYIKTNLMVNSRYTYHEENDRGGKRGWFVYCDDQKFWAFTLLRTDDIEENEDFTWDWACKDENYARSPTTEAFALMDVEQNGWSILKGLEKVPLIDFEIRSIECDDDSMCGTSLGEGFSGVCNEETELCECLGDYYGSNCQFKGNCGTVQLWDPMAPFDGFSQKFYTYDDVKKFAWNTQAIYTHNNGDSEGRPDYDVILFTGFRWIVYKAGKARLTPPSHF